MTLSGRYNDPLPEEEGISVIKHAFSKGITFFDTFANEILLGMVTISLHFCLIFQLSKKLKQWFNRYAFLALKLLYCELIRNHSIIKLHFFTIFQMDQSSVESFTGCFII